jgi:beta-glucosidase
MLDVCLLDDRRHLYLRRHLYALSKAIREGVDVRGYYYWSLMDNFEWSDGFETKFGLVTTPHSTQHSA